MINPIQSNLFVARSAPPIFNEGAASTASKVVAFIAAAIAALGSFAFLPVEAAVAVSAGAAMLLSMLCCSPNVGDIQPRRWYHPITDVFRVFVPQGAVPVVNAGPRVPVRGVVAPYAEHIVVPPPQVGHQEGRRAPVGHRGPVGGVAVMPQAWAQRPPAVNPGIQPAPAPAGVRRVPVGHGHR